MGEGWNDRCIWKNSVDEISLFSLRNSASKYDLMNGILLLLI